MTYFIVEFLVWFSSIITTNGGVATGLEVLVEGSRQNKLANTEEREICFAHGPVL